MGTYPIFIAALFALAAAAQEPPRLSFPVECELGSTCVVQNYFDHDPGPGTRDYACGSLTYDGHDGTDIRLPNLAAMAKGFRVLAAADGKVRAIRDSMADVSFRDIGKDAIKGREAGNGVAVDHGNGWETQYSHMRRGSVLVKPGDMVKRGQPLGLIGLSGWTEFPHLHLTVRYQGRKIDPFVGTGEPKGCGVVAPVWDAKALEALRYAGGGLLDAGFAGEVPVFERIKAGQRPPAPVVTSPALVFWVDSYGIRSGDIEHLRIVGPDGKVFMESRRKLPANKAQTFSFVGKKRREAAWPVGSYRAQYSLTRGSGSEARTIASVVREVTLVR